MSHFHDDLMRTRFPINGDNYAKKSRQYIPRWGKPNGEHDAPFGHARPSHNSPSGLQSFSAYAQLYVYDVNEPDRPVSVNVYTVEAAQDYVRVLREFIAHKDAETAPQDDSVAPVPVTVMEDVHPRSIVAVRPYYHTPTGRGSLSSTRAPFTYEARVIEPFGDMWVVEFTDGMDSAPWRKRQAFKASEMHSITCECAACKGDGIHVHHGA